MIVLRSPGKANMRKMAPRFAAANRAPGSFVRLSRAEGEVSAGNGPSLTLFELESVDPQVYYDVFDIRTFVYDKAVDRGSFEAYVSLIAISKSIALSARIYRRTDGVILHEQTAKQENNSQKLSIADDFAIENVDPSDLILSVEAIWFSGDVQQDLVKNVTLLTVGSNYTYTHTHPQKKTGSNPAVIGKPEHPGDRPYNKPPDPDHIVIALARYPEDVGDVDYICGFGRNSNQRPYFGVPGEGSILAPINYTLKKEESSAFCIVTPTEGGGACLAAVTGKGHPKLNLDGALLSVLSTADGARHETAPGDIKITSSGNRARFEMMSAWQSGKDVFNSDPGYVKSVFHMELNLTLCFADQMGVRDYFSLIVSSHTDAAMSGARNIYRIPSLAIMYGCIGKGTLIRTSGGEKPIEQIRIGDKVYNRGTQGQSAIVRNIWRGAENRMVMIRTGNGSRLCVSESHPVLTGEGWVMAHHLAVGMRLISENQSTTLEAVSIVKMDTEVYNLDLAPGEGTEEREGTHTMYAAGIVVGDMTLQNKAEGGK